MTALGLFYLSACLATTVGQSALSHIPEKSPVVFHWLSPANTFAEIEQLPIMASTVSPDTKAGWFWKQITRDYPELDAVRLDKPIWGYVIPTSDSGKVNFRLVLHVKQDFKKLLGRLKAFDGIKVKRVDDKLIISNQTLAKVKKTYRWNKKLGDLQSFGNLLLHADLFELQKVINKIEEPSIEEFLVLKRLQKLSAPYITDGIHSTSLGLRLNHKTGVNILVQGHLDQKKKLASVLKTQKNSKDTLITGLPVNEQYIYLAGQNSSEIFARYQQQFVTNVIEELFGGAKDSAFDLAFKIWTAGSDYTSSVFGVTWQDRSKDTGFIWSLGYRSAKDTLLRYDKIPELKLMKISDDRYGLVTKRSTLLSSKLNKVYITELDEKRLLYSWNISEKKHALFNKSALENRPALIKLLSKTKSQMQTSRFYEAYMVSQSLIEQWMHSQNMALFLPLKLLLRNLPPVGISNSKTEHNELLTQVFLPVELLKIALAVQQMSRI